MGIVFSLQLPVKCFGWGLFLPQLWGLFVSKSIVTKLFCSRMQLSKVTTLIIDRYQNWTRPNYWSDILILLESNYFNYVRRLHNNSIMIFQIAVCRSLNCNRMNESIIDIESKCNPWNVFAMRFNFPYRKSNTIETDHILIKTFL